MARRSLRSPQIFSLRISFLSRAPWRAGLSGARGARKPHPAHGSSLEVEERFRSRLRPARAGGRADDPRDSSRQIMRRNIPFRGCPQPAIHGWSSIGAGANREQIHRVRFSAPTTIRRGSDRASIRRRAKARPTTGEQPRAHRVRLGLRSPQIFSLRISLLSRAPWRAGFSSARGARKPPPTRCSRLEVEERFRSGLRPDRAGGRADDPRDSSRQIIRRNMPFRGCPQPAIHGWSTSRFGRRLASRLSLRVGCVKTSPCSLIRSPPVHQVSGETSGRSPACHRFTP
jgi:hypothetical protein